MSDSTAEIVARAKARLQEIKQQMEDKIAAQDRAIREKLAASSGSGTLVMQSSSTAINTLEIDKSANWNEQQLSAINMGVTGKSFCLIGAAGTGKTTTLKGLVNTLVMNNVVPIIQQSEATKWLRSGSPGIVLCSFTNMAVRQIAKHFPRNINCCTIHKLLEFVPVRYEVEREDGTIGTTIRFEPSRNKLNKLPSSLKTIVVDESSMVDIELINLLIAALPNPSAVQWIFLGDLNQLPPVYGGPILGKKLLELPIVELTQVYRQALLSPIITLAIKMKNGEAIPFTEKETHDNGEHGKVTIMPWSKPLHWEDALNKAANWCKAAIKEELLDPFKDIILCPYNVNFGVIELNKSIADWLGRQRNAVVWEVIAGFNTHYLAVGDKVLVNKREAIIIDIKKNLRYAGKKPVNPDIYEMDRWGGAKKRQSAAALSASQLYEATHGDVDVDALLTSIAATNTEIEDRKFSCSHQIKVRFINGSDPTKWTPTDDEDNSDDYEVTTLDTASEVNDMLFAYAITVHKSQGSEWRKVFFITHQTHTKMCSRELVYTAITRAAKELYIICEPDRGMKTGTLTKAAKSPRLKGNTLAEKLISLQEKFEKEAKEKQSSTANTDLTESEE